MEEKVDLSKQKEWEGQPGEVAPVQPEAVAPKGYP